MGQGRFFQKSVFLTIIMLISLFHIHKISALSVKSSLFSRALERSQKIQNRNLLTDSSFEMIEEDCYIEDFSLSVRNGSLSHKDSKISTVKINEHKHIGSAKEPYVCVICQKNFKDEFLLKMHQRVHTIDAPYECYSSKDFSGKIRHNRKQNRQPNYCSKRKALKYKLRQRREGNLFEFSARRESCFSYLANFRITNRQGNPFEFPAHKKNCFSYSGDFQMRDRQSNPSESFDRIKPEDNRGFSDLRDLQSDLRNFQISHGQAPSFSHGQANPFEFPAHIKPEDIRVFSDMRDLQSDLRNFQINQTQENLFDHFASLKTKFSSQVSA